MARGEREELRTVLGQCAEEMRRVQTVRDNIIESAYLAGMPVEEIAACTSLDSLTTKKILH